MAATGKQQSDDAALTGKHSSKQLLFNGACGSLRLPVSGHPDRSVAGLGMSQQAANGPKAAHRGKDRWEKTGRDHAKSIQARNGALRPQGARFRETTQEL